MQGSGVGMKNHTKILQEYGAIITPENIAENGTTVGGRLTLEFPTNIQA